MQNQVAKKVRDEREDTVSDYYKQKQSRDLDDVETKTELDKELEKEARERQIEKRIEDKLGKEEKE